MRKTETLYISTTGLRILRRDYLPDEGTPVRGGAVFLHGLGDHSGRHARHLEVFTRRGIICSCVDLPGHGQSDGPRGYIPGATVVFKLIEESARHVRSLAGENCPLGLMGHSMGGCLALSYLTLFPSRFDFSWISSPLIRPGRKLNYAQRLLAHLMARLWPTLAIRSGVRSNLCKRDPVEIAATQGDPLVHRSITVALGTMLLHCEGIIARGCAQMSQDLRLLMTHGGQDEICPSAFSQGYFQQLPMLQKHYALFDDLLHEPFNDIGREKVLATLDEWVSGLRL